MAGPVMRQARLYGNKEGHHATPSEIAVTLQVEPSLQTNGSPCRIGSCWPHPQPRGLQTAAPGRSNGITSIVGHR